MSELTLVFDKLVSESQVSRQVFDQISDEVWKQVRGRVFVPLGRTDVTVTINATIFQTLDPATGAVDELLDHHQELEIRR